MSMDSLAKVCFQASRHSLIEEVGGTELIIEQEILGIAPPDQLVRPSTNRDIGKRLLDKKNQEKLAIPSTTN